MLGSWTATAGQSGQEIWLIVGLVGPAIFALLVVGLVLRSALRQRRYRAVEALGDEDHRAVKQAVAEAERRTVGEILPVIVERSDPHPGADWLAALCLLLVGSALSASWLPWSQPFLLMLIQLGMGAAGFGLARWLPDFKRIFVFEDRATEVAQEQAFQEFYANGLHKTEGATGVLLFVSLLEHRVIVLADEGIDRVVDAEFWAQTDEAILEGIRRGSLRDGLIDGVRRVGEVLAEHCPWRDGDRNEIPDRLIVRTE